MKIRLALGDQEAGEDEMKGHRETEQQKQHPAVSTKIHRQGCGAVEGHDEKAVEGEEVRGEGVTPHSNFLRFGDGTA